jgi:flagellar protein FlbD
MYRSEPAEADGCIKTQLNFHTAQLGNSFADEMRSKGAIDETRARIIRRMIQLTRLNGQALILNSDLIKFIENAPDTVITLVNGEKLLVRETANNISERIIEFRRRVLEGFPPNTADILVRNDQADGTGCRSHHPEAV